MNNMLHLADDLINLLFPVLCNACGNNLSYGETEMCTFCLYDLPFTDFHHYRSNVVAKQFWGRCNFGAATAMLYFRKGSKVQNVIHAIKYKGKTNLAIVLGNMLGEKLKESQTFDHVDLIIPVPLHPRKQKLRGYNQSEYLAQGIAEVLAIPISTTHLLRNKITTTQTKKNRYTRYENMQTAFCVEHAEQLENLHILLVDDVITTGSTLESCSNALFAKGIGKISIATIAFAN